MFKKIAAFSLMLVMMLSVLPVSKTEAKLNKASYKSLTQAGIEAREKIYKHNSKVVIKVKSKSNDPQRLYEKMKKVIYAETSNPNQGDYMKWDVDETEEELTYKKSGSYYYYTFTIYLNYFTTINERNKLDSKVKSMIKGFNFTKKTTTYDKVRKVYDYVCKNVTYAKNKSNKKVYSAYSALVKKKAVCQGYATLLYKTYKTLGIPVRVIAGNSLFSGEDHGWNIVKIGNYYYNIDSTWDSALTHANKNYKYFLKGDSYKGHSRWKDYSGYYFYYKHPMASKAFSVKTAAKASKKTKIAKFKYKKPKFKSINRNKAVFKSIKNATYQLKYSTVNNFKKANTKVVNTNKANYKFKGLKKGVTYFVKFRANKQIGKKKYYSKWSIAKAIQ